MVETPSLQAKDRAAKSTQSTSQVFSIIFNHQAPATTGRLLVRKETLWQVAAASGKLWEPGGKLWSIMFWCLVPATKPDFSCSDK
jgi:hypothetical protein